MTQVPLPLHTAAAISDLAAWHARQGIKRRNWSAKAQASIQPIHKKGVVGITTDLKYLHYQDKGIRPFLMTALEGKTVPIKGKFFRVRGVGLPGMGYQDRKYEKYKGPIYRDQRWRHPGIRPENFMQNAVSQAIVESGPYIRQRLVKVMLGHPEEGD